MRRQAWPRRVHLIVARWIVTYDDGTTAKVKTVLGDIIAYENAHDGRHLDVTNLSDLTWLVWRGCSRLGQTGLAFQAWADTVDDFDPEPEPPLVPPGAPSSASPGEPALPPPS